MSSRQISVELELPDRTYPIDQAQAVLTACASFLQGHLEEGVRATIVANYPPRHREHTNALLAVIVELADRMLLPPHEVPWILLAGTGTPEIVFEAVRRAPRGKWWWMPSAKWSQLVSEAIKVMLTAYCDDALDLDDEDDDDFGVTPSHARNSVAAVVAAARMRLYDAEPTR